MAIKHEKSFFEALSREFLIGEYVTIENLKAREDLNGQIVEVTGFVQQSGRWETSLKVSVRAENLLRGVELHDKVKGKILSEQDGKYAVKTKEGLLLVTASEIKGANFDLCDIDICLPKINIKN